jgi:hypothetical protein
MKMLTRTTLLLTVVSAFPVVGQSPPMNGPPPVLLIQRELVKPGKNVGHNKWEAGWPAAFAKANYPTIYIGMNAVSGINEAWFLIGFPSFEAMEKDQARMDSDASLTAELRRLGAGEADYVENTRGVLAAYVPSVSYKPNIDIATMRYFEILTYTMKPGHEGDFNKAAGIERDGYTKASLDQPWAIFRAVSGMPSGTFYVFLPMRSLAALDKGMSANEAMGRALGPEQMSALDKLVLDGVATSQSQVFAFNPKISYVSKEMKAADPFWR